jgi:hypothetical protein
MTGGRVFWLGMPRRRTIASAVVWRAKMRAARVGFIQTKNRLFSVFALSMNAIVDALMTSSNVVMSYLMPGHRIGGPRAFINDLLFADLAPARLVGRIVDVGGPRLQPASWLCW